MKTNSDKLDAAYRKADEITKKMEEAFAMGCRVSSEIHASNGAPSRRNMERLVDALTLQLNSTLEFVRVAREEILPSQTNVTDSEIRSLKAIESMARKRLFLVQTGDMPTKEKILIIEETRDLTADALLLLSQTLGLTLTRTLNPAEIPF